MKKHRLISIFCLVSTTAFAGSPAVVSVTSLQRHGQVVYRYQVTNNSDAPILSVTVGLTPDKMPSLLARVWQRDIDTYWANYDAHGVEPAYVTIDAAHCTPFQGMVCSLSYQTDSDYPANEKRANITFDWEGTFSSGDYSQARPRPITASILPHTESSVAELVVPASDPAYSTGMALITFGGTLAQRASTPEIVNGRYFAPLLSPPPKQQPLTTVPR
ncbi:hypothetical protein [Pandoraea sp. PE-S2T-3]|uniref:hypothetical protein n=1 Tax=Pandoraea sp. PE-S2T-3 TaxID=1986993 RepID=UPI001124D677|nr:hypothetical protein [Pandoraea sp. PE-S2T-3]